MSEFTIEARTLCRALSTALAFIDDDEDAIPMLGCVAIRPAPGVDGEPHIEVCATDRYVLSREVLPAAGTPFDVLVSAWVAEWLIGLFAKPSPSNGLVTFTRADGGRVEMRGTRDTDQSATLTFTPEDKPMDYRKIVAAATDVADDARVSSVAIDERKLAQVCQAIADRGHYLEPIRLTFGTATSPVVARLGSLTALVMPIREESQS
jgi:hypothetical protein